MKRPHLLILGLLFTFINFGGSKMVSGKDKVLDTSMVNLYYGITGTVYHAVTDQTDSTPLITADLSLIDTLDVGGLRWVALSRDLIYNRDIWGRNWDGKIEFGDSIFIDSPYPQINGWWILHDVMNKRYTNRIDFLQPVDGLYDKWTGIVIKAKNSIKSNEVHYVEP